MFEHSKTLSKVTVKRHADGRVKTVDDPMAIKELEGAVTLEEYRKLLINTYHDLHKNENI